MFVSRTEELDDGPVTTYISVVDLGGNVLMEETRLGSKNRKFEGVSLIDGFGSAPPPGFVMPPG